MTRNIARQPQNRARVAPDAKGNFVLSTAAVGSYYAYFTLTHFESANYYARRHRPLSNSMQIYDVSVPLSEVTPTYPGDPGIEITAWHTIADGDASNVSLLHFGAHSGTHVDAPAHFIEGGNRADFLSLESLIGPAEVVEVPANINAIDEEFAATLTLTPGQRVLFKTRNSTFWNEPAQGFRSDYAYLNSGAARLLVESGIRLVGIDYLSVEQFQSEKFETHQILLSNGVTILEGLDLRGIAAGSYELICLPLKIAGGSGDGAPARAVLRTLN
jgi:arylformamidase